MDQEASKRKKEQDRALDVHRGVGAMIRHNHLDRQQEVAGVTRDDLEDLLGFDGIAAGFGALGMFLLSGAVWLIVENALDADGFAMNSLMGFCLASVIFGAASLFAGGFFHIKKRGRIKRIFAQTKPLLAANTPSKPG